MIVFPNAKINIGLNVVEKRPDGYHNLETIFYPINITDALEAITATEMNFNSSGINIPGANSNNLCIKAYELILRYYSLPKLNIHLHKQIPIGAGLGGGSADAAFFIKLLNEMFSLKMDNGVMENYARQLGADCAFFIQNKPVYAFEKGDKFTGIPGLNLSQYSIVVAMPPAHISTAEAYNGITPQRSTMPLAEAIKLPIADWKNVIKNDFEKVVFARYPEIANLKNDLYKAGALYASMSGSGAAVFGIFETVPDLKHLEKTNRIFYKV